MISLTDEQEAIVNDDFHQLVVACPGSGKTRVLTARVARGVQELSSIHRRVAAVTFTHRAADEVEARLRNLNLETGRVWAGTIHAFALEWVLRPYAGYSKRLRRGFTVAGERYTDVLKEDLRRQHGLGQYDEVPTKPRRPSPHHPTKHQPPSRRPPRTSLSDRPTRLRQTAARTR